MHKRECKDYCTEPRLEFLGDCQLDMALPKPACFFLPPQKACVQCVCVVCEHVSRCVRVLAGMYASGLFSLVFVRNIGFASFHAFKQTFKNAVGELSPSNFKPFFQISGSEIAAKNAEKSLRLPSNVLDFCALINYNILHIGRPVNNPPYQSHLALHPSQSPLYLI
jgi:hypothetical protein